MVVHQNGQVTREGAKMIKLEDHVQGKMEDVARVQCKGTYLCRGH